jgi:hypothetical protein
MELVVLAVIVAVAVWYGMFKPVETIAHAIDDEVQVLAAGRKADHVATLKSISVSAEDVASAQANLEMLRSIKL